MRSQMRAIDIKGWGAAEQGFIDQFGTFYNREEAMQIVLEGNQHFNITRNGGNVALFSEGLY